MKIRTRILASHLPHPGVFWILPALMAGSCLLSAGTTVYVSKTFEVREHDQPVKYVFNGDTRVARVTGSLSTNTRVQRLRLDPGWNLRSLAVTATNAFRQITNAPASRLDSQSVFRWNPPSRSWLPPAPDETLPAGTVLWLHATTHTTLALTGAYTDPANRAVEAGGSFQPGSGLEALPLPGLEPDVPIWTFDSSSQQWQRHLPVISFSDPDFPGVLAPGEAVFVNAEAPEELEVPETALRIRYYHPDHLGSSSVMTDAEGALVEETAFYPFGHPRHEHQPRRIEEDYKFTQKEQDRESGLHYFGRRFYAASLSRWLTTDPEEEKGGGLNLYAYARQNPLKYIDPDGGEITVTPTFSGAKKNAKITEYKIHVTAVLINLSPKLQDAGYDRAKVQQFADTLKATIEKSYSGKQGKVSWSTTVDLRVIDKVSEIKQGEHVFRLVDQTHTRSRGASAHGGRWMEIASSTFLASRPAQAGSVRDYLSPESTGAHELGHTGGLEHRHGGAPNLMQEGSAREFDAKTITLDQIQTIYGEYQAGNLNRGSSSIGSWEHSRLPKEQRDK